MPLLQSCASAGTATGLQGAAPILAGPYLATHMRGSFGETTSVKKTAVVASDLPVAGAWAAPAVHVWPRSVAELAPALAIAARFTARTYRAQRMVSNPEGERVVVLGPNSVGRSVVHKMPHHDLYPLAPVALCDHTRSKRRLKIEGLRPGGGLDADTVVSAQGAQRLPTGNALMAAAEVPSLPPQDFAVPSPSAADTVQQSLVALGAHPHRAGS